MAKSAWGGVVTKNPENARRIKRELARGELRELARGVYTPNVDEPPETIIRRNLWPIVAHLMPDAIVSDRTGVEGHPASDGTVFLIGDRWESKDLPGLKLRMRPGPVAQPGDLPWIGGLRLASRARSLLESLKPARRRGTVVGRALSREEVAERLERVFQSGGESALNALRDEARTLAEPLAAREEYAQLTAMISVQLGTRTGEPLVESVRARLAGEPFDVDRAELFERLFLRLRAHDEPEREAMRAPSAAFINAAFYDAYFSNVIEGTEFEPNEAREIVFEGRIPIERPADAKDVLGTYRIVGSSAEMAVGLHDLRDYGAFRDRLTRIHAEILAGRPEKRPGRFKQEANRAGDTRFVAPDHVEGTLRRGYEIMRALERPFQRALGVMFVVSEVHPFDDGNGRVARAMMNAELVRDGQARIIIPAVYRDDYLGGLRNLSRQSDASAYIASMSYAQRWVHGIDWSTLAAAEVQLRATNAFEPADSHRRLSVLVARDV